jgi:hypothetical protein
MLAAIYHAKKLRLFPESDTIFFCNHEFTTDLINQSLAAFDTSPWDAQPFGQETQVVQQRTAMCALRLFVLLLVDDTFFASGSGRCPNFTFLKVYCSFF